MTTVPYDKDKYYHEMNKKYYKADPSIHFGDYNPLFLSAAKLSAASLIVIHYHTDIIFLDPHPRIHTPDIVLFDTLWKIRNPIGNSFRDIERQVKNALPYSGSIIFDARNLRLDPKTIRERLQQLVSLRGGIIRHLILIEKSGTIIELR